MKDKVRVLQRGLYRAAKAQKERRFGVWWRLRWRYWVEHRKRRRGMCDFPRDLYGECGLYRLRGTMLRYKAEC